MTKTLRALLPPGGGCDLRHCVREAATGAADGRQGKGRRRGKEGKGRGTAEAVKAQQAKAEDRVAARYIAEQKAKGKVVTPQMAPTVMAAAAPAKGAAPAAKGAPAPATKAAAPSQRRRRRNRSSA